MNWMHFGRRTDAKRGYRRVYLICCSNHSAACRIAECCMPRGCIFHKTHALVPRCVWACVHVCVEMKLHFIKYPSQQLNKILNLPSEYQTNCGHSAFACVCVCLFIRAVCACVCVCLRVCNVPQTIKIYHVYLYGKQTKLFQFNCDYTAQLTGRSILALFATSQAYWLKHSDSYTAIAVRVTVSAGRRLKQPSPFHPPIRVYAKLLAAPRRDCKYINLMKFSPLKTWHFSYRHVSESVIRSRTHSPAQWQWHCESRSHCYSFMYNVRRVSLRYICF